MCSFIMLVGLVMCDVCCGEQLAKEGLLDPANEDVTEQDIEAAEAVLDQRMNQHLCYCFLSLFGCD